MSLEFNTETNHHTCHPEHPNILAYTHGLFLQLYKSLCVTCTNTGFGFSIGVYCVGFWGGLEIFFLPELYCKSDMHIHTPTLLWDNEMTGQFNVQMSKLPGGLSKLNLSALTTGENDALCQIPQLRYWVSLMWGVGNVWCYSNSTKIQRSITNTVSADDELL